MIKYQVVLVDDDESRLETYEEYLKSSNYETKSFRSSSVALEYIHSNEYKIAAVFSDFKMPAMTAFQLVEELSSRDIEVPLFIITESHDQEVAERTKELKGAKCLPKPVNKGDMLESLEQESEERISNLEENRELILEFLKETEPMLEELEDIVVHLEGHGYSDRSIESYLRVLHTVKGTASCLRLNDISTFSHHYEEFIGKLKSKELDLSDHIFDVLLEGVDCLREMYSCMETFSETPYLIENLVKIFDGSAGGGGSVVKHGDVTHTGNRADELTVPRSVIDNFWNFTGDITVIKNNLENNILKLQKSITNDDTIRSIYDDVLELSRASAVVQQDIADIRSTSMHSTFRYVVRAANTSAKSCGKAIEVATSGGNIRVDFVVSKLLRSVLVHLVRNSVDHGIEDEVTRASLGKNRSGKIEINCYEEGGRVVVDILDDGKGMDVHTIKAKALERKIYTEEQLNAMSDRKIMNIIFESGFSTSESVNDISGRGVGMDMVKKSIREIGGNIYIKSTLGKGSHVGIHIPISDCVVITKLLVSSVSGTLIGVLLEHLVEVLPYDSNAVGSGVNENNIFNYRGSWIPLIDLLTVCDLDAGGADYLNRKVIVLQGGGYCYGVVVDSVHEIEDIVLREMNNLDNLNPFFSGAATIADESIVLILDVELVGEKLKLNYTKYDSPNTDNILVEVNDNTNQYILFSIEAPGNYAIPVNVVHRLEHISKSCIEYSGGRPLLRYNGKPLPIISVEQMLNSSDLTDIKKYICDLDLLNIIVVSEQGRMFGLLVKDMKEVRTKSSGINVDNSGHNGIVGVTSMDGDLISIIDTGVILRELMDKNYTLNAS